MEKWMSGKTLKISKCKGKERTAVDEDQWKKRKTEGDSLENTWENPEEVKWWIDPLRSDRIETKIKSQRYICHEEQREGELQ